MISVVMPTMWKPETSLSTLEQISLNSHVGEIIVIDNSLQDVDLTHISKIVHIKEPENIYVNPAWNKGVLLSKYDKIFLASDDVVSNWDIISLLYEHITEDKGIIGPHWTCWHEIKDEGVYLNPTNARPNCYGAAMFFHKKSYTEIPNELKIHYGDDWIFTRSGKQNYEFFNWALRGDSEQTSGLPTFNEVKNQDRIIYNNL